MTLHLQMSNITLWRNNRLAEQYELSHARISQLFIAAQDRPYGPPVLAVTWHDQVIRYGLDMALRSFIADKEQGLSSTFDANDFPPLLRYVKADYREWEQGSSYPARLKRIVRSDAESCYILHGKRRYNVAFSQQTDYEQAVQSGHLPVLVHAGTYNLNNCPPLLYLYAYPGGTQRLGYASL